jgi:trans-2-enoyl-CoA reductase
MSKFLLALTIALVSYGTTLAAAKSFRWSCTYSKTASPDGVQAKSFKFEFAYDDLTRKGVVIGATQANVDVHIGSAAVSFMEKLETGAVQTTTISSSGDSVHSRHSVASEKDGKMIPSQS